MEGTYEPAEYRFFTDLARDKKIVMDVGANIGWYSLNLAKMTAIPNVQIHAFEPVPSSYKQLLQNIALNRAQNQIVPHNIGLGSSSGEMVFYVPDFSGSTAASGRNLHPEETNERVKCQIRTADSFLMQENVPQVGLVKCDVEGAELLVLKGAKRLLEEDRPVFILELLRKWSRAFDYHPNDVLMLLRGYGYGCWAIGNERLRFLNEVTDETPEKNYIFLHEGHQVERNLIDPWLSSKPST